MLTQTYLRQAPETGDSDGAVYSALVANIILDDAHSHDGVDSAKLNSSSVVLSDDSKVLILAADWGGIVDGLYSKQISAPAGMTFDQASIEVRTYTLVTGETGSVIYPSITRISESVCEIFVNDNTLNLVAMFST